MRRLVEDVGSYLQSTGIGTVGKNIFVGTMPDTPTNCLAIYSTGGPMPENNAPMLLPSFQILIRKEKGNLAVAAQLADYVFSLLDGKWSVSNRIKGRVQSSSLPGANYRDASGNWVFSLNFQMTAPQTTICSPSSF